MSKNDYYGAIWDANYEYLAHLCPGLHSFIDPEDMDQLHDFLAMMFFYPI